VGTSRLGRSRCQQTSLVRRWTEEQRRGDIRGTTASEKPPSWSTMFEARQRIYDNTPPTARMYKSLEIIITAHRDKSYM